nr:LytR C-terminal domain-containing protein [uncultured Fusobacterium sp.]
MAKKKKKKKGRSSILILILIAILAVLLYFNFRGNSIKLTKEERVLIIGKQNLFAVYEDKLAVKIPFELYVDSDETIQNLVDSKNYENVLEKINSIVPEKLNRYVVIKNGEMKLEVENEKNIPETNIGEKRYILTSSVYSMFKELYHEKNTVDQLNENLLVDVLNANGRGGYARKTGELIHNSLGMKYNAANYETTLDQSYVVLNDISKEKAAEILDKLPEKYFKIRTKSSIPTLANIVVILGSEKNIELKIDLYGSKENIKNTEQQLKKAGYKNTVEQSEKDGTEQSIVEYNKEDYFIAQKLAKILGINDMVENNDLKDRIGITIK